ncbi:hypothetical protein KTH_59360 [Thermosporothrix hazakensis]|uniref:Uncharacterized protein n=1 Tax=Thermosporothrix sp. COM3 TaxID=2490863 RepID=A0A455SNU8_9CHLR|nr:hypothetical protein KTC_15150 [Thermosporothrix sp. COM3]GCE51067.1 hypothetical protein KTH_59360 [Thermosporothrix hazakensis]
MEEETEAIHEAGRSGADVVQPLRFLTSLLIVCFVLFITLLLILSLLYVNLCL